MDKMDYVIAGHQDVRLFTDHINLLFAFSPLSLEPALGRHVVSKVQRWALYLARFKYTIQHVKGDENVFADILRWTQGYRQVPNNNALCSLLLENANKMIPSASSLHFPDLEELRHSQERSKEDWRKLGLSISKHDSVVSKDGRI